MGPYKIKTIISANVVKLKLPRTVNISPVINVSRIRQYIGQVDGQRKEVPQPVIIEGEEEWKVKKILNKRKVRGKDKFLVRWKGFMVEGNTWESRENLENAGDLLREFEEEYRKDHREVRQQEQVDNSRDYREGLPD